MKRIKQFENYLKEKELSSGTIEKYLHDITAFEKWNEANSSWGEEATELTRERVCEWKQFLLRQDYAPATINAALAAMNAYADFMDKPECRLKYVRTQKSGFIKSERQITRDEYERLICTARKEGKEQLALIIETIGATGMRVSELQYVTVEGITAGSLDIRLKGKDRVILLPHKLCRKLSKFAKKNKRTTGAIFVTRNGNPIGRKQIWAQMKKLCAEANVKESKVFPHNLRHLFARMFFAISHNIAELADVLGHSSIETTRIYLRETGQAHRLMLEKLKLVS